MASSRVVLLLSCVGALSGIGCIQHAESPRRSLWIRAVDARDRPVGKFVFMRMTRSESMHRVDDPRDYWNPPQITHILLSNTGKCTLIEPATPNVQGVLFARSVGYKRQTEIDYRIVAKGYEIWRQGDDATPIRQLGTENPATLTFTLLKALDLSPPNRIPPASPDTSAAMLMPPDELKAPPASDQERIVTDLRDESLWNQIENLWETSGNRPAIRFICEYYVDRLKGFSRNQPGWGVPADLQTRMAWMRSAIGANL